VNFVQLKKCLSLCWNTVTHEELGLGGRGKIFRELGRVTEAEKTY